MNIARSFVQYLEDNGWATFGDDIFIGGVPQEAPDTCWWVVLSGGTSENKYITGENVKNYRLNLYYRSRDTQAVYEELSDLEVELNNSCPQLDDYTVISISTLVYPTDLDLDVEDRTVGMLEVNIQVYS